MFDFLENYVCICAGSVSHVGKGIHCPRSGTVRGGVLANYHIYNINTTFRFITKANGVRFFLSSRLHLTSSCIVFNIKIFLLPGFFFTTYDVRHHIIFICINKLDIHIITILHFHKFFGNTFSIRPHSSY